jgi:hypothetical protein
LTPPVDPKPIFQTHTVWRLPGSGLKKSKFKVETNPFRSAERKRVRRFWRGDSDSRVLHTLMFLRVRHPPGSRHPAPTLLPARRRLCYRRRPSPPPPHSRCAAIADAAPPPSPPPLPSPSPWRLTTSRLRSQQMRRGAGCRSRRHAALGVGCRGRTRS